MIKDNMSNVEITVEVANEQTAREWTVAGDNAKAREYNASAIDMYIKALDCATPVQRRYLIPRVMACYRRLNHPVKAKDFLMKMVYEHGIEVMDYVTYTVMASVHGDLMEWSQALECADRACALNDGEINEYLDAVYSRINYNLMAAQHLTFA